MTKQPDEYRWTGHGALAGKESLPWMTMDWVLSQFSSNVSTARKKYVAFVYEATGEGHRRELGQGTHEGRILGGDDFAEKVIRTAEGKTCETVTLDEILSAVSRHYGIDVSEMAAPGKSRGASEARAAAALLVREMSGHSLTALAARLGREVSALSRAARLHADKSKNDSAMASIVAALSGHHGEMCKCQS